MHPAPCAVLLALGIDQLDMRRQTHRTRGVRAMDKSKGMPQLVQHFFRSTFPQQAFVWGQPIKLLMQSAKRHHCDGTVELRLPEQKTKHRDRQIDLCDSKEPGSISRSSLCQHLHHLEGLVLTSFGVIR